MKEEETRKVVREGYARIAKQSGTCCAPTSSCCGSPGLEQDISRNIGYTNEELESVPEGSNLGLGCGNPVALASLREGDVVIDLGSGAGFDCFLAAHKVGEQGRVIGVDMTPEMIEKARYNAKKNGYDNVEFRLGEIENLPVADNLADVLLSNCVINLVPDKARAFSEAFRVLKPGGRLAISDIVLLKELPDFIKNSVEAYVGCLAGAIMRDAYIGAVKDAGFQDVRIIDETTFPVEFMINDPAAVVIMEGPDVSPEELREVAGLVMSVKVHGIKPNHAV
ncbi:MAG: arsenite methyltransferase [Chloroflexota bacterium]|nr:arsenite methyltransferase [Chloroflexota bacterium]